MSLFARTGSRVRNRSRSRRSAMSSSSSWKSKRSSSACLSGPLPGKKDLKGPVLTRSATSYSGKRSSSFQEVRVRRSRSEVNRVTRRSFGSHSSSPLNRTKSIKSRNLRARNSYSGAPVASKVVPNHLILEPHNSYSGNSSSSNTDKDIRRSNSQRSTRSFTTVDFENRYRHVNNFRRSPSGKSGYSYTGVVFLDDDKSYINRSSSQKSARSYTGMSHDHRKFHRSRSEKSTRSNKSDSVCFYLNGDNNQNSPARRNSDLYSVFMSQDTDLMKEGQPWNRSPSKRSRRSLPGEVTGFFKPSPSWVKQSRNKSVGSIGLYGSILCVDMNSSVFDDTIDDVTKDNKCESYLSPACKCLATELSFDDERQLVRTTVGWNPRTGEESQPDYGAFSYQLHEAGKESENVIEFACKTSTIICNTLLVTVLVGLSMTLPITMVSVGVKYLDDCPKEPRIPVYLLVGGCFGMIKLMSTLWRNIQARRYQDIELVFDDNDDSDGAFASTTYRTMDAILFLFLVGWQVAGTYWTLEIWKPLFKQKLHEPRNWCDQTVYMFTVYQIFGCYGVMVVYLLVLILLTCWYRCFPCRRL